jgi:periplasmic copper chaperone A
MRAVRSVVVGAVVAVWVALGAGAAWAHTAFEPSTAAPGTVITLELEVAGEIPGASTTKVQLLFPDGMPIPVVELPPVAGWTATVDGGSLGADSTATGATWTRPSGPPDEDVRLPIRLGPLPETPQRLQFPVLQAYSNGEEVRWIEPNPAGGPEPEHPMAVLELVPGGPGDPPPATVAPATTTTTQPVTSSTTEEILTTTADEGDDGDDGSNAGVVLAVIAAVVVLGGGGFWWWRSRQARQAGQAGRAGSGEPPAGPEAPEGRFRSSSGAPTFTRGGRGKELCT